MRNLNVLPLALLLSGLVAACATAGDQGPEGRNPDVITLAEIEATEARTAFDIVQQLRPRWTVRNRGSRSFSTGVADNTRVVLDDLPPREFDFLREIDREMIQEIRYLSPREATFLYGTGYNAGIIEVITKK